MNEEDKRKAEKLALLKLAGEDSVIAKDSEYADSLPSYGESFGRGAAQGATFGFGDELSAALGALLPTATDKELGRSYSDRYDLIRDKIREENKEAELANPKMYLGGQVTGGIGTAAVPTGLALKGAGLAKKATNIGSGILGGMALDAAGQSEKETIGGRISDAASSIKDTGEAAYKLAKDSPKGAALAALSVPFLVKNPKLSKTLIDKGNEEIRSVTKNYLKANKITNPPPKPFKNVNSDYASKVAQAYEEMKHSPNSPEVKKAYDSLIDETMNQFNLLRKNGLKISRIEPGMENPYKNSADLHKDIKENNHMWYYPTESGFGTKDVTTNHPLLKETNIVDKDKPLLANDIFRIVHDYFGHAKEGISFGPKGEEAAYRIHKSMYSPEAQKALATETRGQNSWVNFGPYGKKNRLDPKNTVYAEQKAGLLPDWAMDEYD